MSRSRPCPISHLLAVVCLLASANPLPGQTEVDSSESGQGQDRIAERLRLLPCDAVLALVAYPRRILASPVARRLPVEVSLAELRQQTGVDPFQVEWILAFWERSDDKMLSFGMIVQFAAPYDWRRLPVKVLQETQFGVLDGRHYRQGQGPLSISVYPLDEQSLILARDATLRRILTPDDSAGLASKVTPILQARLPQQLDLHVVLIVDRLRDLIPSIAATWNPPVARPEPFRQLADALSIMELRARLSRELVVALSLHGHDAEAASRAENLWSDYCAASVGPTQRQAEAAGLHDSTAPASAYARRVLWELLQRTPPQRRNDQLQFGFRGEATDHVSAVAALSTLMLPACQRAWQITDHLQTWDAMHRLSKALLDYARDQEHLPPSASSADNGSALLSWRVHLLPYLGQQSLYQQFRLDERWDSPHNRTLIPQMPEVYQQPNRIPDGRTSYLVPVGRGTLFDGSKGLPKTQLTGDSALNLLLLDADPTTAVIWTQPEDLRFDEQSPWESLGSKVQTGFVGARADGTIEFFPSSLDADALRALFLRGGTREAE